MVVENKIDVTSLSNVPETMLIPLYFKAKETKESGIIKDTNAIEIIRRLDYDFAKFAKDWIGQISVSVNTYLIDRVVNGLIKETNSEFVIINLGSGLDTRQERFPDLKWYHLDLPQSINVRKKCFGVSNATLISKSILDFTWIDEVQEKENVVFIAEGLFMYFSEEEVRAVLKNISADFSNATIIFDTVHKAMVGNKRHAKAIHDLSAPIKFGISSIQEIENWNVGWKQKQVFYKTDYYKKRWRWLRWFSFISSFKKGFVVAVLECAAIK